MATLDGLQPRQVSNGEFEMRILRFGSRAEWLEERRSTYTPRVGSSEIAALLGYGYASESPYTLWSKKTRRVTAEWSEEDLQRLEAGKAGEPYARRMFELQTGLPAYHDDDWVIRVNDDFPAFGASLDAWTDAVNALDAKMRPVELKIVGRHQFWEYEQDELPEKFTLQVQHQIAVTGADSGFLCAVCGTDAVVREIPRHDRLIGAMHSLAVDFLGHVKNDTPPEIDGSTATAETLSLQFPDVDPDTVVELSGPSFVRIAERRDRLKAAEKKIKDRLFEIDSRLKYAMADREYAVLPGEQLISWKKSGRGRSLRRHPRMPRAVRKALERQREQHEIGETIDG